MLSPKRHIAICTIVLALILSSNSSTAQINKWKLGVGIHPFTGFVWAHTKEIDNLKAPIYGSSIDLRVKTANRKYWQRLYHQPFWGVRFYYAYLGNPNITGSVYGILPYIELPVIKKAKWQWNIRGSAGLGYITKPFNNTSNPENGTVGTYINANMGAHGVLSTFISKNVELTLMGGITHFSNGNIKLPNLGLNLPDATLGLTYYLATREVELETPKKFEDYKNDFSAVLLSGIKNTNYLFSDRVTPISLQFKYTRHISLWNRLGGGVDLFYDEGNFFSEQDIQKNGFTNAFEAGIKISHELRISRLSFISDVGVYLYKKNDAKRAIYQQLGLKYQVSKNIYLYSLLKAHFDSADYFGFGLGYSLLKN